MKRLVTYHVLILVVFLALALSLDYTFLRSAKAEPPSQVTLIWEAPESPDVVGYRIFERSFSGSYDYTAPAWEGNALTTTLDIGGHRAFVARAFDADGRESVDSNECSTWDGNPDAPGGLACDKVQ